MTPNYTLHGNIADLTGTADQGHVLVTLVNYGSDSPRIASTSIIAQCTYKAACDSAGNFSVLLFGNDQITPDGTFYTVQGFSAAGTEGVMVSYLLAGGGSHDLSNLLPLTSYHPTLVPPIPLTAIVTNPVADQTISTYPLIVPELDANTVVIAGEIIANVKSYGAYGDNMHDDSAAIAAAVAAVASGGGIVEFPAGVYLVDVPQNSAPSNPDGPRAVLYFTALANVTFRSQSRLCATLRTTLGYAAILECKDSTAVTIEGLRFYGPNVAMPTHDNGTNTGGMGVRLTHCVNSMVHYNEFTRFRFGCVWFTAGTSYSSVEHNYIHDTKNSAIWEDSCGPDGGSANCGTQTASHHNNYSYNRCVHCGLGFTVTFSGVAGINTDSAGAESWTLIDHNIIDNNGDTSDYGNGIGVGNPNQVIVHSNFVHNAIGVGILVNVDAGLTRLTLR